MTLIPVSELKTEQQRVVEHAGLETEAVMRHKPFKQTRTVGKADYSARLLVLIPVRVD